MMKEIVFCDICGTLVKANTTMEFLDFYSDTFYKLRRNILVRVINKISYNLAGIDLVRKYGIHLLKGKNRANLLSAARSFYNSRLKEKQRREVVALLATLRKPDTKIILISATLDFIAQIISEEFNIPEYFATTLFYQNNICTGRIKADLLGQKHHKAKEILSDDACTSIWVITDDKTDVKLAQMANKAHIVISKKDTTFWKSKLKYKFSSSEK